MIVEQETATAEARLRKRVLQFGAGALALLYVASYAVPYLAPDNFKPWSGQDRYETKADK